MKLIEPNIEYEEQIRAYRKEFFDAGEPFNLHGTGPLRRIEDPKEWIECCKMYKNPETVPEGRVQATQFIYVRESDNKIVGMIQVRHCLNAYLEKYAGHIGYSVAPSERRKGYASQMLKLALEKYKELGLKKVLITCTDTNEASRRTILKNGGVYESTVFEPDEKENLQRYWIDLERYGK